MKNIKYIVCSLVAFCCLGLAACNDDFMQQDPQTSLAEGAFLKNEGDLPFYLNQFYDDYVTGHQTGWAYNGFPPFDVVKGSPIIFGDLFSDNVVKDAGAWDQLVGTYSTPQNTTVNGWNWTQMRNINYFLRNYKMAEGSVSSPEVLNKWAAEAYFFKAWDYYKKVMIFGDVPWYETDLNTESPELYAPRTPRGEVMDNVLECINYAVEWLPAPSAADPTGRINKDIANFLKARICLFEGTFRKYHTELNLQSTANVWLEECVEACEALMSSGRYELYTGNTRGLGSYWELFTLKGLTVPHKEAILAKVYDGVKFGHATLRYYEQNNSRASGRYSKGMTRGMLDEYLCIDGLPASVSPLFKGYDGADWREMDNRDPRLGQTVSRPGTFQSISAMGSGVMSESTYGIRYPSVLWTSANVAPETSVTGYLISKHWMCDKTEFDATTLGQQTAIMFRYAEVLLMLAEAKTELGTITNDDLDKTVNALRTRAGFNFTTYPNAKLTTTNIPTDPRLDAVYASKLPYYVSPLLREIRRERRVELFMEGMRYEDLMRWKAGNLFTVPLRGMKFDTPEKVALYSKAQTFGSDVDGNGVTDTFTIVKAAIGSEVTVDSEGFIVCYPRDSRVTAGTLPWSDNRYYWPIPKEELILNPSLVQNDGWEGVN